MTKHVLLLACSLGLAWLVSCQGPPSEKHTSPAQEVSVAPVAAIDYHSRQFLLEVDEAKQLLARQPNLVILEVSKDEEYGRGHLPGAHRVWRPDYANDHDYLYGGMMASQGQMEALLGSLGATSNSFILIYDARGNVDAARLQWIIHEYGHYQTGLLNGGKHAWLEAGETLSTEAPKAVAAEFSFDPETTPHSRLASMNDILAALNEPNVVLLDTRTPEEYKGEHHKSGAAKPGRIPGSINLDWAHSVYYDADFRFRSRDELRKMYEKIGVTPDKKIFVYCHSGVRSAHTAYVLTELLGYPQVYNYDGSWTEWSHHDHLPFEIDEASIPDSQL